jgi:hypothetical protein
MGAEAECPAPATAAAAAGRAEIDTSAPFESVREAVDRFGGSAAWTSNLIKSMFATPNPKVTYSHALHTGSFSSFSSAPS